MTYAGKKSLEELMLMRYFVPIRRNCDGSCCECGSCCDRVLMLTKTELKNIKQYLMQHSEMKRQIQDMYRDIPHRKCPFLDITRENHKCLIYDTLGYPIICKTYNCDQKKMDPHQILPLYRGEVPKYVDMWSYFFNDPIDITAAWQFKDMLENIHGVHIPPVVMLQPEKLPEYFGIK